MAHDQWQKSPPDLVERFEAGVAGIEGLETRKMFGYPAGFIGGNMVTGLHQQSWIVRLPEHVQRQQLDAGWDTFEPMAGRPMKGFLVLPPDLAADPDAAREWVERAAAHVRTMPPKAPKAATRPPKAAKRR